MRRRVTLEIDPVPGEGSVARRVASAAMQLDHANADEIADIELVTSEIVANAVEASDKNNVVSFSIELDDENIRVSATNHGDDFEPAEQASRPTDTRGRGLSIAKAIGHLSIAHSDGETTVSVDVPLSAKQVHRPEPDESPT